MKDKVLIVIPAINEELTVGQVVKELKEAGFNHVLVVDDASIDNTTFIAKSHGAKVIKHPINLGQGAAIQSGFLHAKAKAYEYVITVDADLQHKIDDILKVYRSLIDEKADLVIGSRINSMREKYKIRYYVNLFSNYLTYFLSGKYISDTQSGLRGFNRNFLNNIEIESYDPPGRENCSEAIIKAARKNLKIKEVDIEAVYSDYSLQKGQKLTELLSMAFKVTMKG